MTENSITSQKNIKNQDDIISYLAVKYNMDPEIINKVIRTQFKFIKDTMEQGDIESVQLQYFGKIAVKPARYKALVEEGNYDIKRKKE